MSAFVVSHTHIDALVTAGLAWLPGLESHAGDLGTALRAVNVQAVNDRYNASDAPEPYRFSRLPGTPNPAVIIEAIRCWEYQSCEHHDWEDRSEPAVKAARHFIDMLRAQAVAKNTSATKSDAWEISNPEIFLTGKARPEQPKPEAPKGPFPFGLKLTDNYQDVAEIAKRVRADIKQAIKDGHLQTLKTSVRIDRYAGGCSLDIRVTELGFNPMSPERVRIDAENGDWQSVPIYTDAGKAVLDTLTAIVNQYRYDRSDPQTDYFNTNFYGHVSFDWQAEKAWREAILTGTTEPDPPSGEPKPELITESRGASVTEGKPGNLEIRFASKPDETIRAELKAAGYRWLGREGVWYGQATKLPGRYLAPKRPSLAEAPGSAGVLESCEALLQAGSGQKVLQIAAYQNRA